jgi:hypothetical protein
LKTSDVVAARAMAAIICPYRHASSRQESGGSCQMTIVTLVSGCGNAYPGDGVPTPAHMIRLAMGYRSSSGRFALSRHPAEDHPDVLIICSMTSLEGRGPGA